MVESREPVAVGKRAQAERVPCPRGDQSAVFGVGGERVRDQRAGVVGLSASGLDRGGDQVRGLDAISAPGKPCASAASFRASSHLPASRYAQPSAASEPPLGERVWRSSPPVCSRPIASAVRSSSQAAAPAWSSGVASRNRHRRFLGLGGPAADGQHPQPDFALVCRRELSERVRDTVGGVRGRRPDTRRSRPARARSMRRPGRVRPFPEPAGAGSARRCGSGRPKPVPSR